MLGGRTGLAIAGVAVATISGAAPAAASTLSTEFRLEASGVLYVADPGEENAPVFTGAGTNTISVRDSGATLIKALPPDCLAGIGFASCTREGGLVSIWAQLGDGDDTLTAPPGSRTLAEDGPGNDTIDLSAAEIARAEPGPGADTVIGNGGSMGEGILSFEHRTAPVTVTLTGGADDGEAGEGDDIRGLHYLRMGPGDATIVGTDVGEWIEAGAGNDTIQTGGGHDSIHTSQGADDVHAGSGGDSVTSEGAGALLRGGEGNDRFWAYGESTVVFGGAGDDWIFAPAATRQKIHCGTGFDSVTVSSTDTVAGDCEQVNLF